MSLPFLLCSEKEKKFIQRKLQKKFSDYDQEAENLKQFNPDNYRHFGNSISHLYIKKNLKQIFSSGFNGRLLMRKFQNGDVIKHMKAHDSIKCFAITEEEDVIFTGGNDGSISMLDAASLKEIQCFKIESRVNCLEVVGNKFIFAGSYSGRVYAWNFKSGKDVEAFSDLSEKPHHKKMVLAIKAMGDTLLTSSEDRTIKQWKIETGEHICQLNFSLSVRKIVFTEDERLIFMNYKCCQIFKPYFKEEKIKDIDNVTKEFVFFNITSFSVSQDNKYLVGWNSLLSRIEVWDLEKKLLLHCKKVYGTVFLKNILIVSNNMFEKNDNSKFIKRQKNKYFKNKIIPLNINTEKQENESEVTTFHEKKEQNKNETITTPIIYYTNNNESVSSIEEKEIERNDEISFYVYFIKGNSLDRICVYNTDLNNNGNKWLSLNKKDACAVERIQNGKVKEPFIEVETNERKKKNDISLKINYCI